MTRKGNKVQKRIMRMLLKKSRPFSTREIALKLRLSWHTVQEHCLELLNKGEIERMRIGTTHVWMKKNIVDTALNQSIDNEIDALIQILLKQKNEDYAIKQNKLFKQSFSE